MRRRRGPARRAPITRPAMRVSHAEREPHLGANGSVYLLSLALGVVLFAGLLSLSRGGILAIFLAAAVSTAICYRTASLGHRFIGLLAAAGLLIGVSLAIFGFDRVSNRLEDLSSGSLERLDRGTGRRAIWAHGRHGHPQLFVVGNRRGKFLRSLPDVFRPSTG